MQTSGVIKHLVPMYKQISSQLKKHASNKKALQSSRFFKTGKGEYGEGDLFIGVSNPNIRKIAKQNKNSDFKTVESLINSKIHEERLCGLLILVEKYIKAKDTQLKLSVVNSYLKNLSVVNNWDLVDLTADKILGDYIYNYSKDYKILYGFCKSKNIWERRISILATFYFIKQKQCNHTLKIAKMLLNDKEDLIHKAVGWMLREVGKNCGEAILEDFIKQNYDQMPRTALRYSIERFDEKKRIKFLKKLY